MKRENCDSDSSSSEEEENANALREAADNDFFKDSLFNPKEAKDTENTEKQKDVAKPKSLRINLDQDDQFGAFRVTPEFKQFVAKKLDEILEKSIILDKTQHSNESNEKKKRGQQDEFGVKLLWISTNYLTTCEEVECPSIKKRKKSSIEIIENDDAIERFKEAAVDPEWVLSKIDTKAWISKRKEPEFKYKRKNGVLIADNPTFSSISAM